MRAGIVTNKEDIEEYFRYVQKGVAQMELLINDIKLYSGINVIEKNFTRVPMGDRLPGQGCTGGGCTGCRQ
jgi:hypothetical protein